MHPNEKNYEKRLELGEGLEIWKVNIDALKEQDKNARIMDKAKFDRLTMNIAGEKRLESLPFCYWNGEKERIEIISGHHRTRAARAAGQTEIHVIVDVNNLDKKQVISKQLAHNALQGKDDLPTLQELFKEIGDIEEQFKSGINPDELGIYTNLEAAKLENLNLKYDFKVMQLLFLPSKLSEIVETFNFIEHDLNCFAEMKQFGPFIKAMKITSKNENIRNCSAILSKMCEIVKEYYKSKDQERAPETGDHTQSEPKETQEE